MTDLKTTNYGSIDRLIEAVVLILMATGAVFVVSAGANLSSTLDLRHFYGFITLKQIFFFPLAVVVMYCMSVVDYRRFSFGFKGNTSISKSLTPYMLVLAITLLTLVLIPGIGIEKNFSRRWLSIGAGAVSLSFQPSELAKWTLILFLAAFLAKNSDSMHQFWKKFVPLCLTAGLIVGLIITQDFGTAAVIAMITMFMLIVGRACWWHFFTPLPIILPAFYFAIVTSPTRINRLRAFFSEDASGLAANYQASQSLIAISAGRLLGRGLGRGISKYGHLPEDTTDFIFAIIAEELGFVGAITVILLSIAFTVLGTLVIVRCRDRFGSLLAFGIVFSIAAQAAINIGVVTKALPTKGIPLPFISAGGTSLLLSAAAVGILINIARQTLQPSQVTAEEAAL